MTSKLCGAAAQAGGYRAETALIYQAKIDSICLVSGTPCPRCGGHNQKLVAPNYWECASVVHWSEMVPAGPSGEMVGINRSGPCGHRFHADSRREAAGNYCTCGTYAIGVCAECRVPVCGDHSDLLGGRRLCSARCWASAYSETAEGRVAAERQAADEAHRLQFEQQRQAAEDQRRNAPSALLELVRSLPATLRIRQGRPDGACPATACGWLVATLADPYLENERTRYRYRDLWITDDGHLVVHSVGPREALVRGSYEVMDSTYEQRNVSHYMTRSVNRQLRSARRHDGRRWGTNITVVDQPSEREALRYLEALRFLAT